MLLIPLILDMENVETGNVLPPKSFSVMISHQWLCKLAEKNKTQMEIIRRAEIQQGGDNDMDTSVIYWFQ